MMSAHLRSFVGTLDARVPRTSAATRIDRRKLFGLESDHRHAQRLQIFHSLRQIEDRLCAGANADHRCGCERGEISGNVEGITGSFVYAADSASRKNLNAGSVRELQTR